MADILKGNFQVDKKVDTDDENAELKKSVEEQFESKALTKLGGSIAFVRKKRVVWDLPPEEDK